MRSSTLICFFTLLVSCTTMTYEAQKNNPVYGTYISEKKQSIIILDKDGTYEYISPNLYYSNSFSRGHWTIDNEGLVLKDSFTFNKLKMDVSKMDTLISSIHIKITYSKTYYTSSNACIEFWLNGERKLKDLNIDQHFDSLDSFRFIFFRWPKLQRPIKTRTFVPAGNGIYTFTFENVNLAMRNIETSKLYVRYNVLCKPMFISRYNEHFYYSGR